MAYVGTSGQSSDTTSNCTETRQAATTGSGVKKIEQASSGREKMQDDGQKRTEAMRRDESAHVHQDSDQANRAALRPQPQQPQQPHGDPPQPPALLQSLPAHQILHSPPSLQPRPRTSVTTHTRSNLPQQSRIPVHAQNAESSACHESTHQRHNSTLKTGPSQSVGAAVKQVGQVSAKSNPSTTCSRPSQPASLTSPQCDFDGIPTTTPLANNPQPTQHRDGQDGIRAHSALATNTEGTCPFPSPQSNNNPRTGNSPSAHNPGPEPSDSVSHSARVQISPQSTSSHNLHPTLTTSSPAQNVAPSQIPQPSALDPRPTSSRRLTAHSSLAASAPRPALLSRTVHKSSSAVPTLSKTQAVSITATPVPSIPPASSSTSVDNHRRASSGSRLGSGTMAAKEHPYSATDLLRQAMLHKAPDEEHDQIGSTSSTPPGAVTPRPDLTDKRLPGIAHSCFGQVRSLSSPRLSQASASTSHILSSPALSEAAAQVMSSPALPSPDHHDPHHVSSAMSSHEFSGYPTPPFSSPSSSRRVSASINVASPSRVSSSSYDLCHDASSRRPSVSYLGRSTSLLARGFNPVTASPVVGVTTPITSVTLISHTPKPLSSCSSFEPVSLGSKRLITGGSLPSSQSTPPQTPRSRSQEDETQSGATTPSKRAAVKTTISTEGTTIGPVLGKLTVLIKQGRGLRPSVDPYVVCEFQLSQYISEGPVQEAPSERGNTSSIAIKPALGNGRPMAIPMKSRQSSSSGRDSKTMHEVTDPKWNHKAVFDVVGDHAEIDVSVYDRTNQEAFLGHVRFCPALKEYTQPYDGWFPLEARNAGEEQSVTGDIQLRIHFQKTDKKHYGPDDFKKLNLIGKGTFGQVFLVQKLDTQRIYAMKVLSKKVIIQKKEIAHTIGERNILVRTATTESPFIVGLKFSFQTPTDLFLVTDYMSGGELFWHLQREGRFNETRAKFYIAELILALEHLHRHDIVYRDLKPENILLDANGHIALCDFGLSKANLVGSETTNTFCGTTEYLAPEVLLDEAGYTKMVDYWSLGVLVFEMCCGWSPFYAEDTQQMYRNIAFGKVRFPRDALSTEGRNFVKGLLNRNPKHRLGANRGASELKAHPFFADVDWDALGKKKVVPPFKPKLKSELDVSNFDPEFTTARAAALASGVNPASTPLSPTVQAKFEGFTFVDESAIERQFADREDLSRSTSRDDVDDDDWEKIERTARMSGMYNPVEGDDLFHGRFDE